MSEVGHALVSTDVAFAPPLDLAASLAPLGRSGDDLIDRFEGTRALRTLRLPPTHRPVAYAAEVTDGTDRPGLTVLVSSDHANQLPALTEGIRRTFLTERAALALLAGRDEAVARLARRYPGIVPVLYREPLTALIRSISAQQVNLRWAATVRARLALRYGTRHSLGELEVWTLEAEPLADARLEDLRGLQLTTAKARAVVEVARAAQAAELRLDQLDALDDEELISHLTGLRGIGLWSAEWFLARTLGRPRVVAGDLGVRKAIGQLYDMPALPTELEVRRATAHWGAAATHAQALALHDLARP